MRFGYNLREIMEITGLTKYQILHAEESGELPLPMAPSKNRRLYTAAHVQIIEKWIIEKRKEAEKNLQNQLKGGE